MKKKKSVLVVPTPEWLKSGASARKASPSRPPSKSSPMTAPGFPSDRLREQVLNSILRDIQAEQSMQANFMVEMSKKFDRLCTTSESVAAAFERGRAERTDWYEKHIRETFIEGDGGTRWFNERMPKSLRDMYPCLTHGIAAYVEGLERKVALGIETKNPQRVSARIRKPKKNGSK